MGKKQTHRIMEVNAQLSDTLELLMTITGAPKSKLEHLAERDVSYISRATDAELASHGLTDQQIKKLLAAFELNRRIGATLPEQIHSPSDVANYFMHRLSNLEQEVFWVMCLNTKNRIISVKQLYHGSLNSSLIRVAEVYKKAIRLNAAAIIVAHNHPSGDPTPSADDVQVTRDVAAAGKLLDIDLLDHLVIGNQSWVSLRERGLGFGA